MICFCARLRLHGFKNRRAAVKVTKFRCYESVVLAQRTEYTNKCTARGWVVGRSVLLHALCSPPLLRRKEPRDQVTRRLVVPRAGMGVPSKRKIMPLPGIEQRSFSKFTDWGIPADGYYKYLSTFLKCDIMCAASIPLTMEVSILNPLFSLSCDAELGLLNSGLHKEYPVYGHLYSLCCSRMRKTDGNMEWITHIWHALPRTSALF